MTDPRIAVLSALSSPDWHPVPEAHGMPWDEAEELLAAYDASRATPVPSAPADRAALLQRITKAVQGVLPMSSSLACDVVADAVLAVLPEPADRAAVLSDTERQFLTFALDQAADEMSFGDGFTEEDRAALEKLRRMAVGAQQPETQADDKPAVCAGFQWIGQSFATCERCGQPAWDHDGEEVVAVDGAGPFDTRRTVRPWKPGEADAIRAKWAPATADEEGTP